MKKRYRYHVFYQFLDTEGNNGIGNCSWVTERGRFHIIQCRIDIQEEHGFKEVVITGYTKL